MIDRGSRKRVALHLLTVFLILTIINLGIFFGLNYLVETRRITFGYRVESTDYNENRAIIRIDTDQDGYTIYTREWGMSENYMVNRTDHIERFDIHQNLIWDKIYLSNDHWSHRGSSSKFLIQDDRHSYYAYNESGQEIVHTNRTFFISEKGILRSEFTYDTSAGYSLSGGYRFDSELLDRGGIIIGDYFIVPEQIIFQKLNESTNQVSITIIYSLLVLDIENLEIENLTLENRTILADELDAHPFFVFYNEIQLIKSAEEQLAILTVEYNSTRIEVSQVDLSSNNKLLQKIGDIPISNYGCDAGCDLYFSNNPELLVLIYKTHGSGVTITLLGLEEEYSWEFTWDYIRYIQEFLIQPHQLIFGIRSTDYESSWISIHQVGSENEKRYDLIRYDKYSYRIEQIFKLASNKIAVVVSDESELFYDLQVVNIDPRDFEGLLLSHPIMPHVIVSSFFILVSLPLIFKKVKLERSNRLYPKYNFNQNTNPKVTG
jgi:hypothetical protein